MADQAVVKLRDNNGNAFADVSTTDTDSNGMSFEAHLRYDLQDNRIGWCEVILIHPDGSWQPFSRVDVDVEAGPQKPDAVSLSIRDKHDLVVTLSAHQTSLTGEPEGAEAIVGRIITVAEMVYKGVYDVLPPEPCDAQNRPYFRPNNYVTRAQLAKILTVFNGTPTPDTQEQTFADVPVGSTFHKYIEAVADTGAINGYPCGTR